MSELKAYYIPTRSGNVCHCYHKSDADKVIADLEDQLQAANKQVENLINSASSIMLSQYKVNANKCTELRVTKHALWLARAERAADRARIFYFCDRETELDIEGFSYDSQKKKGHKKLAARLWRIIWLKVERKCRSKAEEYK